MTNETEAPERIWAWARQNNWSASGSCTNNEEWIAEGDTEYRRADLSDAQAARIAELEAERDTTLKREKDANAKAMQHLRRAEKAEIASKNHAAFSHEWRTRAEAAEAKLARSVSALESAIDAAKWFYDGGADDYELGYEIATLAELKGEDQ